MCTNTNPFHHWLWLLDYVLIKSCITPPLSSLLCWKPLCLFPKRLSNFDLSNHRTIILFTPVHFKWVQAQKRHFPFVCICFCLFGALLTCICGHYDNLFPPTIVWKKMSQPMQLFPLQNHVCVPLWPKVLDSSALVSLCTDSFNIHCTWLNLQLLCNILLRNS